MSVFTRHPAGCFSSPTTVPLNNSVYHIASTDSGPLLDEALTRYVGKSDASFDDPSSVDEERSEVDEPGADLDVHCGCIVVIEPRLFLRECIRRGMQSRFTQKFEVFASVDEFVRFPPSAPARLIIFSYPSSRDFDPDSGRTCIERLSVLKPQAPIVVLAGCQDPQVMRGVLALGVKGFIPMSMGFDLAIEAARFVLVGGAFVPAEFLTSPPSTPIANDPPDRPSITAREMLVLKAIKQGKPNKVIAYELNMCESTVKVHVRHIMKKLGAKNRTAVAMKCDDFLSASERRL